MHSDVPVLPQAWRGASKVLDGDESKALTLKCWSGVPNPFDIGRTSLCLHSYAALQSSSDVLN